jgi:hypothetical protein
VWRRVASIVTLDLPRRQAAGYSERLYTSTKAHDVTNLKITEVTLVAVRI